MNRQATKAVENAIALELKKDGLSQKQNGDWTLRFTVASIDMDQRLTAAAMGTRYQCALVEINDDETPVDHKMEERGSWAELGPTKQAVLRCKDPIFRAYVCETYEVGPFDEEGAAEWVRDFCGVTSRSLLSKPGHNASRILWHQLDNAFQGWKALEHA